MPTVSPYYQQRGVANPYYVLDPATVTQAVSALKKEGLKDVNQRELLFKATVKSAGILLLVSESV